jgi:tetratricopeptide (TPR) repeat protein
MKMPLLVVAFLAAAAAAPAFAGDAPAEPAKPSRTELMNLFREGAFMFNNGKVEEALAKFTAALQMDPAESLLLFYSALAQAQLGKKAEALDALKKAMDSGEVLNFRTLETEPALQAIRAEPAFKDVLKARTKILKAANAVREKRLLALGGPGWTLQKMDKLSVPLWVASNADPAVLGPLVERIRKVQDALARDLFKGKAEYALIVLIAAKGEEYSKAFGPAFGVPGVYCSTKGVLPLEADAAMGFLMRGFVHALHTLDQDAAKQDHPFWVTEGFRRLYEDVKFAEGTGSMLGEMNLNLNGQFQEVLQKQPERMIPFSTLMDPKTTVYTDPKTQGIAIASTKMIFLYLQEKGAVEVFYKALRRRWKEDPTGVKALEEVLGKGRDAVEADWKQWLAELKKE